MVKYVFVTGGVLSGIGKGVVTASIGKIFQFRGLTVDAMKIDPYLNVDPGTLNPIEHGEVFVCEEVWRFQPVPGQTFIIAEVDQDFGTYERFLDVDMHPQNNITSGQIYLSVVLKERFGEYLGKTVQVIPHVTSEIKKRIIEASHRRNPDVFVVEVGGTVGDIETMPYLEAIRQLRLELGRSWTVLVHVTLIPYLGTVGQHKTKPTQHSVKNLQSMGLQPDIIIGRSNKPLPEDVKEKISLFCNVPSRAVISDPDLETIYDLPLIFEEQGLGELLCQLLEIKANSINEKIEEWRTLVERFKNHRELVNIAMIGKYCKIIDSYISINEALRHAGAYLGTKIRLSFIESEEFEEDPMRLSMLDNYDGILLTPGFGVRGVEGMIMSAQYAMRKKIPLLGICFGAQLLFIAFIREFIGLRDANSSEVKPDAAHLVVDLMEEQKNIQAIGGTMKLSSKRMRVIRGTKLYKAYGSTEIVERFRHRYQIVPAYAKMAEAKGLIISAYGEEDNSICGIELEDSWIVGVQFHPEFKSRPNKPSPVYLEYIRNILGNKKKKAENRI
ncbi:MAG: CTP synthase [Nitrososphaerota archaeon]